MRIIVAPDSFKESMDAATAARNIVKGIHRAMPSADCVEIPVADGGEGLVDVLLSPLHGERVTCTVTGPMGKPVQASYGWSGGTRTAVIEAATACGVHLVPSARRDIWHASSQGVGELIAAARQRGAVRIIVGLGGSVTNDGGAGALVGLGARLLDKAGVPVEPIPAQLPNVVELDLSKIPDVSGVDITLACDVTNPLCGPRGASAVFGPQKGASEQDVPRLDAVLRSWAVLLEAATGCNVLDVPGAGAAGGLGGALLAVLGARIRPGIDTVLDLTGFADMVRTADVVITGEGRIDSQTMSGKAPWGVQRAAARFGVPTMAFCGIKGPGADALESPDGFFSITAICEPGTPLDEALTNGPSNIAATAERVFRRVVTNGLEALREEARHD